jgi:hypothetical protein
MSLIDKTYFVGDLNIDLGTYGETNLNRIIAKYEKILLIKLFGYTLYKLIAAYNPLDESATEQRILEIIKGKEFTLDGYTYKWNGLINTDKESIIAYYVYYYYCKNLISTTTSTGEVQNEHENAVTVDFNRRMQQAWGRMLVLIGQDHAGFDMIGLNTWTEHFNSLFFFMNQYFSLYPEWQYQWIGSVNMFDL